MNDDEELRRKMRLTREALAEGRRLHRRLEREAAMEQAKRDLIAEGWTPPPQAGASEEERERLGQIVRQAWITWAREQPNPKPSWLVPWEGLSEPDREVDRRIGERLAREGTRLAEHLDRFLAISDPWPTTDVLARLVEAAEYLLLKADCDAVHWEEVSTAARLGRARLEALGVGVPRRFAILDGKGQP